MKTDIVKILEYIEEERRQAIDLYKGDFLYGKLASCNNIYDYIVYEICGSQVNDKEV